MFQEDIVFMGLAGGRRSFSTCSSSGSQASKLVAKFSPFVSPVASELSVDKTSSNFGDSSDWVIRLIKRVSSHSPNLTARLNFVEVELKWYDRDSKKVVAMEEDAFKVMSLAALKQRDRIRLLLLLLLLL